MPSEELPLISIVTPSFNQGRFIRATIESVLRQDYPRIEYWIIDGGSSDETLAVIEEYADDPRLHWLSERDHGQSHAINKGLARCTGAIFAWLNSDDVLTPGALRRVVAAWQAHSPALIYGKARHIDAAGNDLGPCPYQSSRVSFASMVRFRNMPTQPATFAPTRMIQALGGVREDLHFTMDFDLWLRLAQQLPLRHVPHYVALYRLHDVSKTVTLSESFIADMNTSLQHAARRSQINWRQADAFGALFAARVLLTPGSGPPTRALAALLRSVILYPLNLPDALRILAGGLARRMVGDWWWAQLRALKVRFG